MVYYRDEQIDDAFFALSHPIRRAVLDQLSRGEKSVADISEQHEISAAQMTKHLKILERGGLLARRKLGREHRLSLQPEVLKEIMSWVQKYEQFWNTRFDALEDFLESEE